jgi:hypothetical protein
MVNSPDGPGGCTEIPGPGHSVKVQAAEEYRQFKRPFLQPAGAAVSALVSAHPPRAAPCRSPRSTPRSPSTTTTSASSRVLDQRPIRIGPKTNCSASLVVVTLRQNMDRTVWEMGVLYYTGSPWCRQGGTMNNEVGVIAGVGLDQKTRKSRWPARLDLIQSASGLFLGLFMWGHMAFVSSILGMAPK